MGATDHAKKQLLRSLNDSSKNKELNQFEKKFLKEAIPGNRPVGEGGKTTLLGVRCCSRTLQKLFVSTSFVGWSFEARNQNQWKP